MKPINERKRRVPPKHASKKDAPEEQPSTLDPRIQRKHELHAEYPSIPIENIHVDPYGVTLFKNPKTNGWCSKASSVLPYYEGGK